jgi:hypothetical protein
MHDLRHFADGVARTSTIVSVKGRAVLSFCGGIETPSLPPTPHGYGQELKKISMPQSASVRHPFSGCRKRAEDCSPECSSLT